jgi:hypothetical protein
MAQVLDALVREAEKRSALLPAFAPRPSEGRRERFLAAFSDASRMHVIAEFKAQSPSLGVINVGVSPEERLERQQRSIAARARRARAKGRNWVQCMQYEAIRETFDMADLVTEMTLVKHPFREQGIKAQAGIEF